MPTPTNYGSTGRPPGKFHIRHSLKEFTYNLEFSHPPFDIIFIEITNNNNNNNINYIDNGGSGNDGTDGDTNDTAVPVPVGNNSNTNVVGHRSNRIDTWFTDRIEFIEKITTNNNNNYYYYIIWDGNGGNAVPANGNYSDVGLPVGLPEWFTFTDQIESINCSYKFNKYKLNIDGISSTTTATPAIATTNYKTRAEGISNEGGEDAEAAARLSEWFANRFESNQCNYKYKFNIDGISTTTTTVAPATANYKTSAEGISTEDGEDDKAPGLSEWFAGLFESNRCNSISNNNSNTGSFSTSTSTTNKDNYNETFHHFFLFKLISLYLIITKSFSSKQFTKEQKEKQHHHHQQQQQHYHGKRRHQFHLEQQQKHQHFKQEQHNMERMVTSIVLKLTLVAWDMWTYRNGF